MTGKSQKYPLLTAPEIHAKLGLTQISIRTVQRRLEDKGLFGRVAAKKPYVNKKNQIKRIRFAQQHINWTPQQWKRILWSDESKFNLVHSDGIRYVRRPVNKRFDPKYTIGTVKHSGGNIMEWGAFNFSGIGPLHRVNGIMDQFHYKEILENEMLPYAEDKMPVTWVFQHDNDPKHTTRSIKKWIEDNYLTVIEWPPQSPDLNPIENLWAEVERRRLVGN